MDARENGQTKTPIGGHGQLKDPGPAPPLGQTESHDPRERGQREAGHDQRRSARPLDPEGQNGGGREVQGDAEGPEREEHRDRQRTWPAASLEGAGALGRRVGAHVVHGAERAGERPADGRREAARIRAGPASSPRRRGPSAPSRAGMPSNSSCITTVPASAVRQHGHDDVAQLDDVPVAEARPLRLLSVDEDRRSRCRCPGR